MSWNPQPCPAHLGERVRVTDDAPRFDLGRQWQPSTTVVACKVGREQRCVSPDIESLVGVQRQFILIIGSACDIGLVPETFQRASEILEMTRAEAVREASNDALCPLQRNTQARLSAHEDAADQVVQKSRGRSFDVL